MNFTQAVSVCLNRYTDFRGRSRRSEYWWFALFNFIVEGIVPLLIGIIAYYWGGLQLALILYATAATLISLLLLLPTLAVTVRRLHDTGHSGWWIFISLVPLIGSIWLLVLLLSDSAEENQYGLISY